MSDWIYNNKPFTEDMIGEWFGYVYLIENLTNGKKYVGKKQFSRSKSVQRKGKKKRIWAASDWIKYWGSNKQLQQDVEKLGSDNFIRTILYLTRSKSHNSYIETKEIFQREAIIKPDYYNDWVSCKITRKHLAGLKL